MRHRPATTLRPHRRRSLLAGAALAGGMLLGAPAAHAQLTFGGADLPPVMASRDFDALVAAVGFDEAQRDLAGALFDDAQVRMFEACALPPSAETGLPTPEPDDRRTLVEREQRRRSQLASVMATTQAFFDGLAAVARPEQKDALERERLACQRRLLRALMGVEGQTPVAKHDLERSLAGAKLSAERRRAAEQALAAYRQRLAALFVRLADESLALPAKQAAAREASGKPKPEPTAPGIVEIRSDDIAARQAVSGPYNDVLDQLSDAHRDGLAALEPAVGLVEGDALRTEAFGRIWPRCAMDGGSPRTVFRQLAARAPDDAARQAVNEACATWLRRWWPVSMKMTRCEDVLRRAGGLHAPGGEEVSKARAQLRELRQERAAINRDAFRALASVDPSRRDFYLEQAKEPEGPEQRLGAITLPADPQAEGAGGNGGGGGGDGDGFQARAMIVMQSADGEMETMVFDGDGEMGGAFGIAVGPDGVPMLMGDLFGDGLGGPMDGGFVFQTGDGVVEIAGGRLPTPISRTESATIAGWLGTAEDNPAYRQLYEDYTARAGEIDRVQGEAVRAALKGSAIKFEYAQGQADETTPDSLRAGIGKLDAAYQALAEADDAFIAAAGAAANADKPTIARVQQERARHRLRDLRYPVAPSSDSVGRALRGVALLAVLRDAGLAQADAAAATAAFDAWSPAAVAALESARGTLRSKSVEMLLHERASMRQAMESMRAQERRNKEAPAAAPDTQVGESITFSGGPEDAESTKTATAVRAALNAPILQLVAGRDALLAAVSPEGQALLTAAWLRAAAPQAYQDTRDAMPKLDAALALPGLSPEKKRQIEALRTEHFRLHQALSTRLATMRVAQQAGEATHPEPNFQVSFNSAGYSALRFERAELNSRTVRRLRMLLGAELAAQVPGLDGKPTETKRITIGDAASP